MLRVSARTFMLADVVLPQRRYRLFTYLVPPRLEGRLHIGSRVLVPLGRHLVHGLVFSLTDHLPRHSPGTALHAARLREIQALVETPLDSPLDARQIALARRVTEYYLAPPASGLRLLLPPAPPRRIVTRYSLTEAGKHAEKEARLSELARRILGRLLQAPKGLTTAALSKMHPEAARVLPRLMRKGWIQATEAPSDQGQRKATLRQEERRPSSVIPEGPRKSAPLPSTERIDSQARASRCAQNDRSSDATDGVTGDSPPWWDAFVEALARRRHRTFLMYASREARTRRLCYAIEAALAHRRSVLIVAPEIDQADYLTHRLQVRFGARVTAFHSGLALAERTARWQAARDGTTPVAVGTHGALFLPLPALGLIWVEDEEHPAFKAEQSPYYHARTVAEMRADLEQATLVLSTSHPSLETYDRFSKPPDQALVHRRAIPSLRPRIVHLRDVPYDTVLSETMIQGMARTLEAGGRVILFLNRKGFSRALVCRDCGHVQRCRPCGVTLVVHRHPQRLACPYCSRTSPIPETCPACASTRWQSPGFGTERIECCVRERFPAVPVARFDRDSIPTRSRETEVCQAFARGEIRILIGTELLIHTQPVPRASFVGLPYADAGLHLPDFRSSERTYHVLAEVVGLATPDGAEPDIVIQTLLPTHHAIQAVARQDPAVFYEHERELRRELGYPPFSQLVQIMITGNSQAAVEATASSYAAKLRASLRAIGAMPPEPATPATDPILGPIPAIRSRRSTKHRWAILLKNLDHKLPVARLLHEVERECEPLFAQARVTCEVNVDPQDLA